VTPPGHVPIIDTAILLSSFGSPISAISLGTHSRVSPLDLRQRTLSPNYNTTMSDNERTRDRPRERDNRREPREDRTRDQAGPPSERRNRSRSPRKDRGGRRDNRNRSRSPVRRDEREKDGARDQRGRGRGDRDDRERRDIPRGPRGGASASSGPRRSDFAPRGGPPPAPRDVVKEEETPDVEMKEDAQKPEDMDDDTWEMKKMMGFAGFKSTKNRKVPGNDKNYAVRRDKQMEARQYMNRQGGFNRPLSPGRG
jgi:U4/U6.U5 tri-snRNP-associated protein 3